MFSSQNRNKGICFVEKKWGFGTNEEKRNIFYLFILRFKAETAYDKWQINKSMQIWADEKSSAGEVPDMQVWRPPFNPYKSNKKSGHSVEEETGGPLGFTEQLT